MRFSSGLQFVILRILLLFQITPITSLFPAPYFQKFAGFLSKNNKQKTFDFMAYGKKYNVVLKDEKKERMMKDVLTKERHSMYLSSLPSRQVPQTWFSD